jgi:hypothetical protein
MTKYFVFIDEFHSSDLGLPEGFLMKLGNILSVYLTVFTVYTFIIQNYTGPLGFEK